MSILAATEHLPNSPGRRIRVFKDRAFSDGRYAFQIDGAEFTYQQIEAIGNLDLLCSSCLGQLAGQLRPLVTMGLAGLTISDITMLVAGQLLCRELDDS